MVKGNREMIIKIIDWSSRIMAVFLAIGSSLFAILSLIMKLSTKGVIEIGMWNIIIIGIGILILTIFFSSLQLGLFLAPGMRQRSIKCRLGVAILMLPSTSMFLSCVANITKMKILTGLPLSIADIIVFIVSSISSIVYIIQYYLLLKGEKINTYIPPLEHNTIFRSPTMDGVEEPLFVLKYSKWRIAFWGVGIIMGIGTYGVVGCWVFSAKSIVALTLWSIFLLLIGACIWWIIDIILFKEIKLYKDRIVKKSYLLGQKEVKLEDAYISKSGDFYGLRVKIYVRKKRFGLKVGVSFVEDLLTRKDRMEFYNILAELSGRDVKDLLERKLKSFKPDIWTKKLIKEDNKLPIIEGLEEPLFVLRQSKWRVWGTIGLGIVLFGTFAIFAFSEKKLDAEIMSILIIALCIKGGIDIVLFKEIKLYKDRIVMTQYMRGQKEVKLKEAYIIKDPSVVGIGAIRIFSRQMRFAEFRWGDIGVVETLFNPKEIKKFYSLLAKLSGREEREFKYGMPNQKLIKGGNEQ